MKNKFIPIAVLISLVLAGCASTKVWDSNGKCRFSTQADTNFYYHGADGTGLYGIFNHSSPTTAGGNAIATVADSIGKTIIGALLAGSTSGTVGAGTGVASTVIPLLPKLGAVILTTIPTKKAVKP